MKRVATLLLSLLASTCLTAKPSRIEPPFWWADMPVSKLQIQFYGENIGHYRASIDYPGVTISKQVAVDSPNYLFLYLELDGSTEPGTLQIELKSSTDSLVVPYELKEREPTEGRNLGFDSTDLIYLMMPDRFANGDTDNDNIEGLTETVDRSDPTKRQGGDIKGIHDRLDYFEELGMTALWIMPVFENNSPPDYGGYHGYAASDLYAVDARLGTNEEYKQLITDAHSRGLKVIMDMIHNHIGLDHWWMDDLPTADWVHDLEENGFTNFRSPVPADPNASKADRDGLVKGWFVQYMPDLNQRNELLADYLIQNSIWWIEYSGIDGIRMDTYLYPYPEYMARWVGEVLEAYPKFNIVGEVWAEQAPHEAYWQQKQTLVDDGYDSKLPSVTDFPLCFSIRNGGLTESFGWETGLSRIYYALSQDFLYSDPSDNVIFLDNHDMGRIYEQLGKDEDLFKIAYSLLITLRGIPQVYYGTELMLGHENRGGDDEAWRQTMLGGWPDDSRDVFTKQGRNYKENEIFEFIRKRNVWRRSADAVHHGKFMHFIPQEGTYVYFRILRDEAVMVAINSNPETKSLELERFSEVTSLYKRANDPFSEKSYPLEGAIELAPKSALILELTQSVPPDQ